MSVWLEMVATLRGEPPHQLPELPGRVYSTADRDLTVADVEGIGPEDLQRLTGCSAEAAAARVAVARATGDWSHCLTKQGRRG